MPPKKKRLTKSEEKATRKRAENASKHSISARGLKAVAPDLATEIQNQRHMKADILKGTLPFGSIFSPTARTHATEGSMKHAMKDAGMYNSVKKRKPR